MLGKMHKWTHVVWCFLFWKIISYWFSFFKDTGLFTFSVSYFLCEFWQYLCFKELVHFMQVIKFVCVELFILYYPFNVHKICSDFTSFIFFWPHLQHVKFPGQVSNLCHSSEPRCCSGYVRSLTHCGARELPPLFLILAIYVFSVFYLDWLEVYQFY